VVGPDGGEGAKTVGGLNITDNSNGYHGGRLKDGDGFNSLLLVKLRSGTINFTNDVRHTSLESHECSEVRRKTGVILGE